MDEQQVETRAIHPAPKPESTKHLRVLSNGAVYDTVKGRIVSSKNVTTKITPERAVEFSRQRQELKREALVRAANAVAAQGGGVDGREMQGDLAFVEAIGEAMTMKALSVNDPKAVDAARFLFQETGIAEARVNEAPAGSDAHALIGAAVVEYVRRLHEGVSRTDIPISSESAHSSVVDGEVSASPADPEAGE